MDEADVVVSVFVVVVVIVGVHQNGSIGNQHNLGNWVNSFVIGAILSRRRQNCFSRRRQT